MNYKEQAEIFKTTFDLKYEPMAISFTNDEVPSGRYEKTSICKAMKLASQGESFIIDQEVSICQGAVSSVVSMSHTPDLKRRGCRIS